MVDQQLFALPATYAECFYVILSRTRRLSMLRYHSASIIALSVKYLELHVNCSFSYCATGYFENSVVDEWLFAHSATCFYMIMPWTRSQSIPSIISLSTIQARVSLWNIWGCCVVPHVADIIINKKWPCADSTTRQLFYWWNRIFIQSPGT